MIYANVNIFEKKTYTEIHIYIGSERVKSTSSVSGLEFYS